LFSLIRFRYLKGGEMLRGYAVLSKDLYGVRDPLHSKRIARGWRPEIAKAMGDDLEGEVMWLLAWTGGTNGIDVSP
jgi:hypothetical protein